MKCLELEIIMIGCELKLRQFRNNATTFEIRNYCGVFIFETKVRGGKKVPNNFICYKTYFDKSANIPNKDRYYTTHLAYYHPSSGQ